MQSQPNHKFNQHDTKSWWQRLFSPLTKPALHVDNIKLIIEQATENNAQVTHIEIRNGVAMVVTEVLPDHATRPADIEKKIQSAFSNFFPGTQLQLVVTATKNSERSAAKPPNPYAERGELWGIRNIQKIIAVASGKGGVGKSTTSVNLAVALARMGKKTGLLDCDVYGPSIPRMLGINNRPAISADKKIQPLMAHGLSVMSMGFLVPEDAANIWRGPMVMGAVTQMLGDVDWGALDYLIVDMPPGTGDAQLTLCQRGNLSGAIIVSTPQDIALIDARKAIAMFQKIGTPILGIIENMSFFECPNCHHRSDIFAHGGARAEAEKLGVPFLGEIPLELKIRENMDLGKPMPDMYHKIAAQII